MIPGRASVVRDRYGVSFVVGVPESRRAAVRAIPGTAHDHLVDRYAVPVAQEDELRRALAGLDVAWSVDHRAERVEPAHRCAVCRHPLAAVLVAQGQRTHWGCRREVSREGSPAPEPEGLW